MKCSGINCPMQYPYDVKKCLCVDTCPYATTVPYTNADRIRAMSDEELAEFIPNWSYTNACKCEEQSYADCNLKCEECVLDWLQQPAEEE